MEHMEPEMPKSEPYFFNISLKLILENEKGEILGLRCKEEGRLAGYYDLPGGRINSDELNLPYEESIAREMEEEVGKDVKYKIDIRPVSLGKNIYFSKKLGRENCILMIFFKAKYLGGEICISSEHIGYKWINPSAEHMSDYFIDGFLDGVEGYLNCNR